MSTFRKNGSVWQRRWLIAVKFDGMAMSNRVIETDPAEWLEEVRKKTRPNDIFPCIHMCCEITPKSLGTDKGPGRP